MINFGHKIAFMALLMSCTSQLISDVEKAQKFLDEYNREAADMFYRAGLADWAYATNITDYNRNKSVS